MKPWFRQNGFSMQLVVAGTALLTWTCAQARATPIFNASFETPVVTTGFINDPTATDQGAGPGDSPWVFTGSAGIAASNAKMGQVTVPQAPDGNQVGFVDQGGDFSQVLDFPSAGQYVLTFNEAGTGIYSVLLDSVPIVASHLAPDVFSFVTAPFSASAGAHTLTFQDTDPRQIAGPLPAFIDSVSVVPEPTAMVFPCIAAALLLRRRA